VPWRCWKLHLPFALASNAPHHKIELCLRVTGLLPHFAGRIFSAYDVQRWKPDPALFLFAAERLGVPPQRCAVVEDSLPGVQAGLAAGMQVIALQGMRRTRSCPPGGGHHPRHCAHRLTPGAPSSGQVR
jgi:beta-phosphoglucomutase-like phosphatase (HAD superfamily)